MNRYFIGEVTFFFFLEFHNSYKIVVTILLRIHHDIYVAWVEAYEYCVTITWFVLFSSIYKLIKYTGKSKVVHIILFQKVMVFWKFKRTLIVRGGETNIIFVLCNVIVIISCQFFFFCAGTSMNYITYTMRYLHDTLFVGRVVYE